MDLPIAHAPAAVKPVVAVVALAADAARAAPALNQVPGGDIVTAVSPGSGVVVGLPIIDISNGATGTVDGKVAITWGGATAPPGEATDPLGFNLGSNAMINFGSGVPNGKVLDIDASGNPSPNSFGFEATTAFVKNAYSSTVTGGTVCTTTGLTTWTACP